MKKISVGITGLKNKPFLFVLCILFLLLSSCRTSKPNETKGLKPDLLKSSKVRKGSFFRSFLYGYDDSDEDYINSDSDTEYDYELEYEEIYD